ncbi:hypothetical protein QX776_18155 [Alteromonadaceae bacterium BrNp21-10]|nr:hypothetical protein [Alteromonadaceae bacterium BrNp21-10]
MDTQEDKIKSIWRETTPDVDPQLALRKVLNKSFQVTAVKDVVSLFVGWAWVILLGFGASAYSAKRRFDSHKSQPRSTAPLSKNKLKP